MRGCLVGLGGWLRNSFIDFPGTVATVLFYSGCNLRCPYCHNPALVDGSAGEQVDPSVVWDFLCRRRGHIDGVVLSGGEPTIHASAADAAAAVRELGYAVKLDTNGLLPEAIERIRPDYLALDVKTRPSWYSRLLGATVDGVAHRVRESIRIAKRMGERAEVRVTLAPGIVNDEAIEEIAHEIAGVRRVYLQPMRVGHGLLDPALAALAPSAPDTIEEYRQVLSQLVGECRIRGATERA
jgi:pyruvate formate lyase activating enzyme